MRKSTAILLGGDGRTHVYTDISTCARPLCVERRRLLVEIESRGAEIYVINTPKFLRLIFTKIHLKYATVF